jgi:multidrug efflux pump subunit AcrA (membrane-fusion protein)
MQNTSCILMACLLALPVLAAEKKPESPPTHKVKAAPFKVEVKLNGVFAAKNAHEIQLKTKSWADLKVLEAVSHGAVVKKGDLLVQLDPEKLDKRIHDSGIDLELSKLDLELAKTDLKHAEATIPLDLAGVERAYHQVKEDFDRYLKVQKPYDVKSAKRTATSSANYLAYAEEELKQLKKMYEADDVSEETEEIILRRAQDGVDRARHSLAGAKIRSETSLKVTIPREDVTKKEGELRKRLELEKARSTSETDLKKKQLGMEKQKIAHAKALEAHAKLQADRKLLTVKAPADGVVFYGSFNKGTWSGQKVIAPKLKKDGKLLPESVFMTVVEPRPLRIYALLDEKDLLHVRAGAKGDATAKADPENDLPATVESVSRIPVDAGKFEVVLNANPESEHIMPGMGCSVKLMVYENKKALTVPTKSIHGEGDGKVVYVKTGKGHRKATVKTGQVSGDKTEILKGIKAGDEVLLEKPSK